MPTSFHCLTRSASAWSTSFGAGTGAGCGAGAGCGVGAGVGAAAGTGVGAATGAGAGAATGAGAACGAGAGAGTGAGAATGTETGAATGAGCGAEAGAEAAGFSTDGAATTPFANCCSRTATLSASASNESSVLGRASLVNATSRTNRWFTAVRIWLAASPKTVRTLESLSTEPNAWASLVSCSVEAVEFASAGESTPTAAAM